jgi:hypothetical protein
LSFAWLLSGRLGFGKITAGAGKYSWKDKGRVGCGSGTAEELSRAVRVDVAFSCWIFLDRNGNRGFTESYSLLGQEAVLKCGMEEGTAEALS